MFIFKLSWLFVIIAAEKQVSHNEGKRIYGGISEPVAKFPYQVQIIVKPRRPENGMKPICGGSIIAQNVVLTAGHCSRKQKFNHTKFLVRVGTSFRNGTGGTTHYVKKIVPHPVYRFIKRSGHSLHDIELMFVEPPFQYNAATQRIAVASTSVQTGELAVVSGWGATHLDRMDKKRPEELQAVNITIIDHDSCNEHTKWNGKLVPHTLCAGINAAAGSCKGDSGGPLVVNNKQVGVVSYGSAHYCVLKDQPRVYTNVTAYVPWIKSQTEGQDVIYK